MTADSLSEWQEGRGEAVESEESSGRQYHDAAVDPNGAFWLAASDGLMRYAPLTWRSPASVRKLSSLVHGLAGDDAGRLWFLSGAGLHVVQNDRHQEYPLPASISNNVPTIRALFPLKDGTLFLEAGEQCLQFHPDKGAFNAIRHGLRAGSLKPLGLLKDGRLCVQTLGVGAPEEQYRLGTEIGEGAGRGQEE